MSFPDISLETWGVAAGVVVSVLLIVVAVKMAGQRLLRNSTRTSTSVDDLLLELVNHTRIPLLIFPSLHAGARLLPLDPGLALWGRRLAELSLMAQAALWVAALIDFWLLRYRLSRAADPGAATTIQVFRIAAAVVIWAIALVSALDLLGVEVRGLVAGLGIGGVAIALATQNILSDLFASLSIVVDKPFVVGDAINVGDAVGIVERIGLKTTRVRVLSGEEMVFSNNDLLQSRIRNYRRMERRRVLFRVGVTYQTDPAVLEQIPRMLRQAVEAQDGVAFDRSHLAALGASAYEFEAVYYINSPDYTLFMDIQQSVLFAVATAFRESGVDLAYPTQTLFVERAAGGPTPVR